MPQYTVAELRSMGVYAITCLPNNRRYFGETTRFRSRWTKHLLLLNKGMHHNRELQSDWDLYGADAFEFRILEFTDWDKRMAREKEYIAQEPTAYNVGRRPR